MPPTPPLPPLPGVDGSTRGGEEATVAGTGEDRDPVVVGTCRRELLAPARVEDAPGDVGMTNAGEEDERGTLGLAEYSHKERKGRQSQMATKRERKGQSMHVRSTEEAAGPCEEGSRLRRELRCGVPEELR